MHENLELVDPVSELDNLQLNFVEMLKARLDASPDKSLEVHKDSSYTENPMEREDVEQPVKVSSLIILCKIQNKCHLWKFNAHKIIKNSFLGQLDEYQNKFFISTLSDIKFL